MKQGLRLLTPVCAVFFILFLSNSTHYLVVEGGLDGWIPKTIGVLGSFLIVAFVWIFYFQKYLRNGSHYYQGLYKQGLHFSFYFSLISSVGFGSLFSFRQNVNFLLAFSFSFALFILALNEVIRRWAMEQPKTPKMLIRRTENYLIYSEVLVLLSFMGCTGVYWWLSKEVLEIIFKPLYIVLVWGFYLFTAYKNWFETQLIRHRIGQECFGEGFSELFEKDQYLAFIPKMIIKKKGEEQDSDVSTRAIPLEIIEKEVEDFKAMASSKNLSEDRILALLDKRSRKWSWKYGQDIAELMILELKKDLLGIEIE